MRQFTIIGLNKKSKSKNSNIFKLYVFSLDSRKNILKYQKRLNQLIDNHLDFEVFTCNPIELEVFKTGCKVETIKY